MLLPYPAYFLLFTEMLLCIIPILNVFQDGLLHFRYEMENTIVKGDIIGLIKTKSLKIQNIVKWSFSHSSNLLTFLTEKNSFQLLSKILSIFGNVIAFCRHSHAQSHKAGEVQIYMTPN